MFYKNSCMEIDYEEYNSNNDILNIVDCPFKNSPPPDHILSQKTPVCISQH
jgi:hypothetical protein